MFSLKEFHEFLCNIETIPQLNLRAGKLSGIVVSAADMVELLLKYVDVSGAHQFIAVERKENGTFEVHMPDLDEAPESPTGPHIKMHAIGDKQPPEKP